MPFRVSYFFGCEEQIGAGWSECWWNSQTNDAAIQTTVAQFALLLEAVHAREVFADYARIADVGVGRLPNIVEFQVHNTSAEVADVTDYPTNAFLVELQGTTTTTSGTETINRKVRTRQWFRGIADRHIVASHFTPQGNYSNAVAALRAHLLQASNGWCLRVVSRAHEIKSVASLSITGEARVPAHGYPPRFQVRMSKINPRVGVNKIWDARTLTADTFQLERFKTLDSDWVYAGGGCCRRIEYLYPPIQEFKVLRATKRNVGRPSRLYSGKTKKVLR